MWITTTLYCANNHCLYDLFCYNNLSLTPHKKRMSLFSFIWRDNLYTNKIPRKQLLPVALTGYEL